MTAERLIGRLRLVRAHTICVSCYNREREVVRGVNAKGATPKKWALVLKVTTLLVSKVNALKVISIGLTTGAKEMVGYVERCWPGWTLCLAEYGDRLVDEAEINALLGKAPGEKSKPARQRVPKGKVAVPVHGFAARFGLQ
ncbi:hypothetical protein [Cupriavidus sp. H19C3]|uniref:hypothetical protein n=1 Tax=Cupriavidus sp. H19C3 TaxID=3241603 RepID=UPI003BF86332